MTTAEKRALLETLGEPWPDCRCHGVPLLWQKNLAMAAGGRFYCRAHRNASRIRRRRQRVANGVCVFCGGVLATETLCRVCADRHADLMATPKQRLLHQSAAARYLGRRRADEGFRPTGVGLAVFAAWNRRDRQ